jgi:hypothetical protein
LGKGLCSILVAVFKGETNTLASDINLVSELIAKLGYSRFKAVYKGDGTDLLSVVFEG